MAIPLTDAEREQQENENERNITAATGDLLTEVVTAQGAVSGAMRLLSELTNDLYDIELAEGAEGRDARRELEDAARSLRHVERIINERQLLDS